MAEAWERLDWDSGCFGFPTARLLPARLSRPELEAALREMRAAGVRLAYWSADPDHPGNARAADALGGFAADLKTTYVLDPLPTVTPASRSVPVGFAIAPLAEADKARWRDPLAGLGLRAGTHSRFRVDPRFPEPAFRSLYGEWMRKSLSGEAADAVLAASEGADLRGLVTVSARGGEGSIGLLAVAGEAEGRGLGTALVFAAVAWFAGAGCRRASVVTQGRNAAACGVYGKAGFRIGKREDVRHFWLDPLPLT